MSRVEAMVLAALQQGRGRLAAASALGATAAMAAVFLLGLSGWFLTAAAIAGALGPAVAAAFNFLLPSAAIRFLAILRTAARYGERVLGHEAALRALAQVRPQLFSAIAAGPPERMLRLSIGESSARLVQDVDALQTRIIHRSTLWGSTAAVLAGAGLVSLAGASAIAVFVMFAVGFGALGAVWARRVGALHGAAVQESIGRLKERTAVLMGHAAEVRVFGMGAVANQELIALGEVISRAQGRRAVAEAAAAGLMAASGGLTCALVLAAAYGAETPVAALTGLAVLAAFEAIGAAVRGEVERSRIDSAVQRLDMLLPESGIGKGDLPSSPTRGAEIDIDGAVFGVGERLIVQGRSGSGKTSLLLALLALSPERGVHVRIAGVPPSAATRRFFAYAPQAPTIPADSVREALKLGERIDDGALWEALEDACLADRVWAMPKGLDTWLGASGVRLSGGEAKRLSLARAYVRQAPWLLLDEPTEGLDPLVEAEVLVRLERRLHRTKQGLVLVSHSAAVEAMQGAGLVLNPDGTHSASRDRAKT